jgi:phenylalanyl-tRNA synthetase beta chain
MLVSFNWLRELVDFSGDVREAGERLTMVGLAVDGVEPAGDDAILELDITTNRGDCLSHLGVAREMATIFGLDVHLPAVQFEEADQSAAEVFSISIVEPDLCSRYCGRYIEGVTVGPSPPWLVQRLESVGIRSINNVADATNLVLMELGQPLHSFDADTLEGHQIVVRRAEFDEILETLDGVRRELDPSMLVIADSVRAVAMAGIMGGARTEISSSTTNVLLESAWFDPMTTRKTARALNLNTEASYRFERGADVRMARFACDRTTALIQELAGGTVYRDVIDVYPGRREPARASLRRRRISEYLGMPVPDTEVLGIFQKLGFIPTDKSMPEGWEVQVPSFRHDISREEDLLEEIARHHGYDRFPSTLPGGSGQGQRLPWHAEETAIRNLMSGLGYSESCNIAFSNADHESRFAPGVDPVVILNPLSEDSPILRTSLIPTMLRSFQWNLNRGTADVQLFEIGKVYPTNGERQRMVLAATGSLGRPTVHRQATDYDFFDLKGDVEELLGLFALEQEPDGRNVPDYYHPGRSMCIGSVAVFGELHSDCTKLFKLRHKVYLAEIDIEELYRAGLKSVAAESIPKYPSVRRDFSLLLVRGVHYSKVISAVRDAAVGELARVDPFDRMDTGPFPESCYSLAITVVYQSSERTLTDAEVQDFDRRILERLEGIGAKLRG